MEKGTGLPRSTYALHLARNCTARRHKVALERATAGRARLPVLNCIASAWRLLFLSLLLDLQSLVLMPSKVQPAHIICISPLVRLHLHIFVVPTLLFSVHLYCPSAQHDRFLLDKKDQPVVVAARAQARHWRRNHPRRRTMAMSSMPDRCRTAAPQLTCSLRARNGRVACHCASCRDAASPPAEVNGTHLRD